MNKYMQLNYHSKELTEYWDNVYNSSWHLQSTRPTISDMHYRSLVERFFRRWAPIRSGLRVLKLDMYNEATWTRYAYYYLEGGADVAFVEISRSIAQHAWQIMRHEGLDSSAHPFQGDFRKLPFRDGCFDVSCSFGSIEHTPEWFETLAEQIRVVKPGGIIIVGVPNLYNIWMRATLCALARRLKILDKFTNYEIHYKPNQLKAAMEKLGVKHIEISGYHLFPKLLRWIDLWCNDHNSRLSKIYERLLEPLLSGFTKLERRETRANLLAEMLIAIGIK